MSGVTPVNLSLALSGFILLTFLSWIGTRQYIAYAHNRNIVDIPNERSSHVTPTPIGGGVVIVALFLALVLLCLISFPKEKSLWLSILGGGIIIATLGWLDDRKGLSASVRLAAQTTAVIWTLYQIGGMPTLALGPATLKLGYFGHLLALFGGVWAINLYNFMDGIDGLAAGEAFIVTLAAGFLIKGSPAVSLALFGLGACILGFLIWNWSPAKIFMGDAGSGFLGFTLFTIALYSELQGTLSILIWGVLLSVFIIDTTLTLIKRVRERKPIAEAHRDHLYQQPIISGCPHENVTGTILLITLSISFATLMFSRYPLLIFIITYSLMILVWFLLYSRLRAVCLYTTPSTKEKS